MNLQINKAHFPVTVLGPGRRIGIWFQGCSIRCRGCVSRDTWPKDAQRTLPLQHLMHWCQEVAGDAFDGVTLSGGEPFDQPQGLMALLNAFHAWRHASGRVFDLLCYSGYPLKTLQKRYPEILSRLDAILPEPYLEKQPADKAWRGSANQALIPLSDLGVQRYGGAQAELPPEKTLQVSVENDRIWMIGIPGRGDMEALETLCRERGLNLGQVSWRR